MKFAKLFVVTAMTAVAATAQAQQTVQCNATGAGSEQNLSAPSSTCTVSQGLTSVVPVVARMTISSTLQTLTAPGATAFGATQAASLGVTDVGPTITISSNTGYALASSSAATFVGGNNNKPASDLLIKVGTGSFDPIGPMTTGASATNSDVYNLSYKTRYTWTTDVPGTYTLTVNYTLTAP